MESGPEAVTVRNRGTGGAEESDVASDGILEERVWRIHDIGFAHASMYAPGECPGIRVSRLASQSRDDFVTAGTLLVYAPLRTSPFVSFEL